LFVCNFSSSSSNSEFHLLLNSFYFSFSSQTMIDKYFGYFLQLQNVSNLWMIAARKQAQQAADTEEKVTGEYNQVINMLKDQIAKMKGNLNTDCMTYASKFSNATLDIVKEESTQIKPSVIQRVHNLLENQTILPERKVPEGSESSIEALRAEQEELQKMLSLDIAFLKFKKVFRRHNFETKRKEIEASRKSCNKERFEIQKEIAPLPRQLQSLQERLEALELEKGTLSKELENLNQEKLELLMTKVRMSKRISEIEEEFGFKGTDNQEEKIEKLEKLLEEGRADGMRLGDHSDYAEPSSADRFLREVKPSASEREARELRQAIKDAQESKILYYKLLHLHRDEVTTFEDLASAGDPSLLASFIERKCRIFELWDQHIAARNLQLANLLGPDGHPAASSPSQGPARPPTPSACKSRFLFPRGRALEYQVQRLSMAPSTLFATDYQARGLSARGTARSRSMIISSSSPAPNTRLPLLVKAPKVIKTARSFDQVRLSRNL